MTGDATDTGVMYTLGDSSNNSNGVNNYPDKATQDLDPAKGLDPNEIYSYSGKTGDILNLLAEHIK